MEVYDCTLYNVSIFFVKLNHVKKLESIIGAPSLQYNNNNNNNNKSNNNNYINNNNSNSSVVPYEL